MERFRELVSKLGVVNVSDGSRSASPYPASNNSTQDILEQLPITKQFIESIPYENVRAQATENDEKASQAKQLMKRVNDLVQNHVSETRELKFYMAQLSKYQAELAEATKHAEKICTQLQDLDKEISLLDETSLQAQLEQLQKAEDASFEKYAREERARVDKKKREYLAQLASFEKERLEVIAKGDDETVSILLKNKHIRRTQKGSQSSSSIPSSTSHIILEAESELREPLIEEADLNDFLKDVDDDSEVKTMGDVRTKSDAGTEEILRNGRTESAGTDESRRKGKKTKGKISSSENHEKKMLLKNAQPTIKAKTPSTRRLDIIEDEDFDG